MSASSTPSNTSTQSLKRAYQFLLHAYPSGVRSDRGVVELDTLLSVSRPNQRIPKMAEARAITREGIRERIRSNAGKTTREVLAHGGALGVLFTMSLQLYWFGVMTYKMDYDPNTTWAQIAPFVGWMAAVAVMALGWSLHPTRIAVALWQLSNILGVLWLIGFVGRKVVQQSTELSTTLVVLGTIVCLLALSSLLVIWCWSEIPGHARAPLGLKIAGPSIALPIWASPLFLNIDTHGNNVLLLAIAAMLVIAFVDPRPLIGLAVAVITPLVGGSIAIASSGIHSSRLRILLPSITALLIALVIVRCRILLRRLNNH
jgi:hypothetical protein